MQTREWMLKRNCSLSPRQLAAAYGVLGLVSFLVSGAFVLSHGAWQIFSFAVLEMAGVALAFLHYARHATDHEHVALMDGCLLVERVLAGHAYRFRLDPCWTRVSGAGCGEELVRLESRGVTIQVGCFVPLARRCKFAQELRQELQRHTQTHSATND